VVKRPTRGGGLSVGRTKITLHDEALSASVMKTTHTAEKRGLPNNEATLTPAIAILSWRPARAHPSAILIKLQFMKKSIQIIAILLLFNGPSLMGQQLGLAKRVSTHIELRKDTILLGEPMYFQVVITNISDDIIYVQEGGDYRGGRPETFRVLALTEKMTPWMRAIGPA